MTLLEAKVWRKAREDLQGRCLARAGSVQVSSALATPQSSADTRYHPFEPRSQSPCVCYLPLLLGLLATAGYTQEAGLKLATDRPGNLFGDTTTVTVKVTATGLTSPEWKLIDFDQQTVATGKVTLTDGKGSISLDVLPRGYYELTCTEGPTTAKLCLGVVRDHSAVAPADTRLNVDGSDLLALRREDFDALAQMLQIAGVGWVRERFSWGGTEPQKGVVDCSGMMSADAYARRSAGLQIFHDGPAGPAATARPPEPADLREVYLHRASPSISRVA